MSSIEGENKEISCEGYSVLPNSIHVLRFLQHHKFRISLVPSDICVKTRTTAGWTCSSCSSDNIWIDIMFQLRYMADGVNNRISWWDQHVGHGFHSDNHLKRSIDMWTEFLIDLVVQLKFKFPMMLCSSIPCWAQHNFSNHLYSISVFRKSSMEVDPLLKWIILEDFSLKRDHPNADTDLWEVLNQNSPHGIRNSNGYFLE